MESSLNEVRMWASGAAAVVFGCLSLYLRMGWRGGTLGGRLMAAMLVSCAWAALDAAGQVGLMWSSLALLLEILRPAAWSYFLVGLLAVATRSDDKHEPAAWVQQSAQAVFAGALMMSIAGFVVHEVSRWIFYAELLMVVWLLVLVEQVYRNFPSGSRWGIKPLILGLACVLSFDFYLFAEAALLGRMDNDVLAVRGIVHALVGPLAAMSAVRSRDWTFRISVSRQLVFHSTALAVSGLYLLLVAAAGYYVRWFGGSWGRALQTAMMFGGLFMLVFVAFSGSFRARLRVWLNKNLFAYRYDYREAWLKFTKALSGVSAGGQTGLTLEQSVISALAELVESPGGVLWLRDADNVYRPRAKLNCPLNEGEEAADAPLAKFMHEQAWIVNLEEWRSRPSLYQGLAVPPWLSTATDAWLLVPLISGEEMVAFVVLATARAPIEVNWEVLDLLKTAGRQAASYLGRAQATAALLEAQKFDSFNRMSAFVVHDLKNLVAQLSLMLKNAARHKDNPEFQEDMLLTVENVAERMRGLMTQLQNKSPIEHKRWVDVGELCGAVLADRRVAGPEVSLEAEPELGVFGQAERLQRIIGHVVQNATEATPEHGKVSVAVRRAGTHVRIEISDTGCGMTPEFVRERLFRPFQTTKQNGMGIGAFEVQQYVSELGGRVEVDSEPDVGTRFVLLFPLSHRNEASAA
ncbi:MAG: prsK [Rhodocyclales bacterium]|nr:prsK [Rhodocyclales bacterium]